MDTRVTRLEEKVAAIEKIQKEQGKKIDILDQRSDGFEKFVVKFEIVVETLDKTTQNIEKSLTNFITKQETKEEERRKAEIAGKEQEISKWKQITFELGKWILIILGAGQIAKEGMDVFQNLFK